MPPSPPPDLKALVRALAERGIEFVVIGGVRAAMQGVPATTYDLDIVLDPNSANLDRAHALLTELETCFREHLPSRRLVLERDHLDASGAKLLMTRLGPLDILSQLSTQWRFADLTSRVRTVKLSENLQVRVLDLAALIEVKERIGREKDQAVLPLYRRTLAERDRARADE